MSSTLIGYVVSPAIRHSSFWMLFPAIRLPEILSPSRTRTIFRLAHSTSNIHMRPSWSFIHVGNRLSFLKPEFNGLMNELMHEWMNEWMNEWTNERMTEMKWMNERYGRCLNSMNVKRSLQCECLGTSERDRTGLSRFKNIWTNLAELDVKVKKTFNQSYSTLSTFPKTCSSDQ